MVTFRGSMPAWWRPWLAAALALFVLAGAARPAWAEMRWVRPAAADLAGWRKIGPDGWRVVAGDLDGRTRRGGESVVMADRGYQDFMIRAAFRCADCTAGILVRATSASAGLSAIYIPLSGPDLGKLYRVSIDQRTGALSGATAMPAPPPASPPGKIDVGPCRPLACAGIRDGHGGAPLARPAGPVSIAFDRDGWNQIEIVMRGDAITASINGRRLAAARMDRAPLFGRIGLRVAGTGPIQLRDLRVLDLMERPAGFASAHTDPSFERRQLSDAYYSEGAAIGDINRDGHVDLVAGPFYYLGPDFAIAREIYPPETANIAGPQGGQLDGPSIPGMGMSSAAAFEPGARVPAVSHGSYSNAFQSWVHDFDGDGWPDILAILGLGGKPTFSAHLFINPGAESRSWDNYEIASIVADEQEDLVDIDGDGRLELVMRRAGLASWDDAEVGILRPDPADVTRPWIFTPISEKATWRGHGSGVGDIDGDGRLDIVNGEGWWRQPEPGVTGLWTYHKQLFRADDPVCGFICGGAQMSIQDVDGDGLADVVTSLVAHGPGLAWYRQRRDAAGAIGWETHLIMGSPESDPAARGDWAETDTSVAFTELHALGFADMNGDGLPDIVTGKRWWSHGPQPQESEIDDPPVLYWFELSRAGGTVRWIPHLIDNRSGVGTQIAVGDVDGDGRPDVLTSARKGTFLFNNRLGRP
jgi:hypothetical protein